MGPPVTEEIFWRSVVVHDLSNQKTAPSPWLWEGDEMASLGEPIQQHEDGSVTLRRQQAGNNAKR